jgi:hypothetical protein
MRADFAPARHDPRHDRVMRTHPARWAATTDLAFVPALVSLWAANWLHVNLGVVWMLQLRWYGDWRIAHQVANTWMLGVAAAAYTVWILAVARQWVSTATGGGFVIAAHGLILRIVVELPQSVTQTALSEVRPPEPYATLLPWGRAFGLVAFVMGLGFVAAAVFSERLWRRSAVERMLRP